MLTGEPAPAFSLVGSFSALSNAVTPVAAAPTGAPIVMTRTLAAGATGAPTANNITVRLNKTVTGVSTWRRPGGPSRRRPPLREAPVVSNATTNAQTAGVVSYNPSTFGASFNLNASPAANTRYTATLTGTAAAIRDTGGTRLETTSWSSTTGP